MYAWCPQRPKEGTRSLWTEVTAGCDPQYGCWGLSPSSLEKQSVLLYAQPTLQPNGKHFHFKIFYRHIHIKFLKPSLSFGKQSLMILLLQWSHKTKAILKIILNVYLKICMKTSFTYQIIGMKLINYFSSFPKRYISRTAVPSLLPTAMQKCFYVSIDMLNLGMIAPPWACHWLHFHLTYTLHILPDSWSSFFDQLSVLALLPFFHCDSCPLNVIWSNFFNQILITCFSLVLKIPKAIFFVTSP